MHSINPTMRMLSARLSRIILETCLEARQDVLLAQAHSLQARNCGYNRGSELRVSASMNNESRQLIKE